MTSIENRSTVEWVPVQYIMANPLNPRKNDAIRTSEMQTIISKRGWEEPLTVYKKGKMHVVLAGHRRLYAARQADVREIPVYIVEAPRNHQEEIERIASLQSGRVDWTRYEWAKFTYERWLAWGKPSIYSFGKKINVSPSTAKVYINVLDYFPSVEIEANLLNQTFSFGVLDELQRWIVRARKFQKEAFEDLTEDLIRKTLLNKIERKLVKRDHLRGDKFVETASPDDFRNFLVSTDSTLEDWQNAYGIKNQGDRTFQGHLVSIGIMKKTLKSFTPNTNVEKEKAIDVLKNLESMIKQHIAYIEKTSPDKETN